MNLPNTPELHASDPSHQSDSSDYPALPLSTQSILDFRTATCSNCNGFPC
jgi:hypothetical protein